MRSGKERSRTTRGSVPISDQGSSTRNQSSTRQADISSIIDFPIIDPRAYCIFAIIDFPIIDFSIIDPTPECTFPIMHHRPALPQSSDPTFSIIDFPIIDPERVQGTFAILYFFRSAIVFQVKFKCTFFDLTLLEFCVNLLI